jgi:hypothetical protein
MVPAPIPVDRVQTGVRLEKRLLRVLKALAAYLDLSMGDLLEGILLHAFEGATSFSPDTLAQIATLRSVYGLTLTAADSHLLVDRAGTGGTPEPGPHVRPRRPARRHPRPRTR